MHNFCSCGHHKDQHSGANVSGKYYPECCKALTYPRVADSIYPDKIGKFDVFPSEFVICGCLKLDLEMNEVANLKDYPNYKEEWPPH